MTSSSEPSIEPYSVTIWVTSPRSTSTVARTGRALDHDDTDLYTVLDAQQSPMAIAIVAPTRGPRPSDRRGLGIRVTAVGISGWGCLHPRQVGMNSRSSQPRWKHIH